MSQNHQNFLAFSRVTGFRLKKTNLSITKSSTSGKQLIETLMEEVQPKVIEKNEYYYRQLLKLIALFELSRTWRKDQKLLFFYWIVLHNWLAVDWTLTADSQAGGFRELWDWKPRSLIINGIWGIIGLSGFRHEEKNVFFFNKKTSSRKSVEREVVWEKKEYQHQANWKLIALFGIRILQNSVFQQKQFRS